MVCRGVRGPSSSKKLVIFLHLLQSLGQDYRVHWWAQKWCSLLVATLGTVFRVQCALPNIEMYAFANENGNKIGGISQEKNRGWCSLLVMMLGNDFTVQYGFPNMESMAMLNNKSHKIGKIYKNKYPKQENWLFLMKKLQNM